MKTYAFLFALLTALLLPFSAQALGVGEVAVESHLNEPLRATVPLIGVEGLALDSDLVVRLGSEADFERLGVSRDFILTTLKFELQGGETPQIRITTDKPVREPFLHFVLDIQSPKAQLLKELTVLLDPAP